MRILVLSDSHGCVDPMQQCVELVQPQAILLSLIHISEPTRH